MSLKVNYSISLKFKGVKHLDPILKNKMPTSKEMWSVILGDSLLYPHCPDCNSLLQVEEINIEYLVELNENQCFTCNSSNNQNWTSRVAKPLFHVKLVCQCGITVKAVGSGITFYEDKEFSLDTLHVIEIERGEKINE